MPQEGKRKKNVRGHLAGCTIFPLEPSARCRLLSLVLLFPPIAFDQRIWIHIGYGGPQGLFGADGEKRTKKTLSCRTKLEQLTIEVWKLAPRRQFIERFVLRKPEEVRAASYAFVRLLLRLHALT